MNFPNHYIIRKLKLLQASVLELLQIIRTLIKLKMAWLIPTAGILILIAILLALLGGTGPLAPFVYPLI